MKFLEVNAFKAKILTPSYIRDSHKNKTKSDGENQAWDRSALKHPRGWATKQSEGGLGGSSTLKAHSKPFKILTEKEVFPTKRCERRCHRCFASVGDLHFLTRKAFSPVLIERLISAINLISIPRKLAPKLILLSGLRLFSATLPPWPGCRVPYYPLEFTTLILRKN